MTFATMKSTEMPLRSMLPLFSLSLSSSSSSNPKPPFHALKVPFTYFT
uniref:Uncharacterized protein n=1 Tax=Rhizophora mucronata TaxID=61149 RepID=A0A2P2QJL5_RHIMU